MLLFSLCSTSSWPFNQNDYSCHTLLLLTATDFISLTHHKQFFPSHPHWNSAVNLARGNHYMPGFMFKHPHIYPCVYIYVHLRFMICVWVCICVYMHTPNVKYWINTPISTFIITACLCCKALIIIFFINLTMLYNNNNKKQWYIPFACYIHISI